MMNSSAHHLETLAVHLGRAVDPASGAVTPSISLSTTFERLADGSFPSGYIYARSGNPNRQALESALTALEGGATGLAFASGQAASAAVLQSLSSGDHLILPSDLYHGTRYLVTQVLRRWGLQATFVDMRSLAQVRQALQPITRLVWVETPSNPQLQVADIAAIAELAHHAGALCAVDNTWATPVLQQPLALGADLVVHSTTKYIGGHSDVLGGCVIVGQAADAGLSQRLREIQTLSGGVPSPFDCWLLLRSLPTLPYRVRAQSQSAASLARYLSQHPRVAAVHYPGLETHPGHAIAARQMSAFGGMLSFQVQGSAAEALGVAARVQVFTRATSLGGVESLIEQRASVEGPGSLTPPNLLRLSIGLEHVDDLLADLEQSLAG
jgi:cystathionine gamma-synthase